MTEFHNKFWVIIMEKKKVTQKLNYGIKSIIEKIFVGSFIMLMLAVVSFAILIALMIVM